METTHAQHGPWSRGGIRHQAQAPEEAGLREGELGPAKGEGIGGLRTASAAGQANGPASPKVRTSPDFMSRSDEDLEGEV